MILAGVAINLILGDNGLIKKAKYAKTQTEKASVLEEISLIINEIYTEKQGEVTLEEVKEWLENNKTEIELEGDDDELNLIYKGYKTTISSDIDIVDIVKVGEDIITYTIEQDVSVYPAKLNITVNENIEEISVVSIQKGEEPEVEGNTTSFDIYYPGKYKITIKLSDGTTKNKIINMNNVKGFSIFHYMVDNDIALEDSGFIEVSASGIEQGYFAIGQMGGGKWSGSGSWSVAFSIPYDRLNLLNLEPNRIKAEFMQQADGKASVAAAIGVTYKDGSLPDIAYTDTRTNEGVGVFEMYPAEFELKDKEIDTVNFSVWGTDVISGGCKGYLSQLYLLTE